ncbi:MAG: thioredoxin family protein [Elusimicrobia bacterium]|nr:thioredoxin family protein [Elusimicrobiota bacterium]
MTAGTTLLAGFFLALALPAAAGEWMSFDADAFAEAKQAGKVVVLDFHADWCPTCRQQKAALGTLLKRPRFAGVVGFVVDFDRSDALASRLGVANLSTVIVYRGGREVARSTGVTEPARLKALLEKALPEEGSAPAGRGGPARR